MSVAIRYDKEAALLPHYRKHLEYYSTNVMEILRVADADDLDNVATVLDVGCGDARACAALVHASSTLQCLAVDYCAERLALALKHPRIGLVHEDLHAYADKLRRREIVVDLAICNEVLEHLQDPRALLDTLKLCARRIVGTVPINLPYVAHLTVYPDVASVKVAFPEFTVIPFNGHCVLDWKMEA